VKKLCNILLVCLLLLVGCGAEAADNNAANPADNSQAAEQRYVKIFSDASFNYYLDKASVKWVPCPNTDKEYIIDAWIKMERSGDNLLHAAENGAQADQYSYPAKYYLEHYYMRPSVDQVQFLCELEVTGRPDNNIKQRKYDAANWENLVPGSIEDSIYQAVVKIMGKKHSGGTGADLGNMLEDVFRISV